MFIGGPHIASQPRQRGIRTNADTAPDGAGERYLPQYFDRCQCFFLKMRSAETIRIVPSISFRTHI